MIRRLLTIRVGTPPGPVLTCLGRWASAPYGVVRREPAGLTADAWAIPDLLGAPSLPFDSGASPFAFGSAVGVSRGSGGGEPGVFAIGGTLGASERRAGDVSDPFGGAAASLPRGGRGAGGC